MRQPLPRGWRPHLAPAAAEEAREAGRLRHWITCTELTQFGFNKTQLSQGDNAPASSLLPSRGPRLLIAPASPHLDHGGGGQAVAHPPRDVSRHCRKLVPQVVGGHRVWPAPAQLGKWEGCVGGGGCAGQQGGRSSSSVAQPPHLRAWAGRRCAQLLWGPPQQRCCCVRPYWQTQVAASRPVRHRRRPARRGAGQPH